MRYDSDHAVEPSAIDLNADLGESFGSWSMGDDDALLDIVTSANVACGFHAGDPSVLLRTCQRAAERNVSVGAHVAYRDLAGFGRNFIDVEPARLTADVLYQLSAIAGMARVTGALLTYVKPHGALYNTIVHHEAQASAVVEALRIFNADASRPLALLGLPGGIVMTMAQQAGIRTVSEAFADRAYTPEGTLVSRRETGAVLHDADQVAQRVVRLAQTGKITAIDGTDIEIAADSVCLHGDSPGAVQMAQAVRDRLLDAGVTLRPFSQTWDGTNTTPNSATDAS